MHRFWGNDVWLFGRRHFSRCLSLGPLCHRSTWRFVGKIYPSSPSVMDFCLRNMCLCRSSDGHPFLLSVFAVRLMEIRLCLPSRAQQSQGRSTSPGDFHHIRFGHPSRRHPSQPSVFGTSVSAFRLEDIRLTHLCRPSVSGTTFKTNQDQISPHRGIQRKQDSKPVLVRRILDGSG